MLDHPFLEEAQISNEYIDSVIPVASYTAPWHPIDTQITNWITPHTKTVVYNFNKFGYRGTWTESDLPNTIWCFGDSQTAGMGNSENDLWPTVLGEALNCKTINFGIAGGSHDTIASILLSVTDYSRPKAICVLTTLVDRREIISKDGKFSCFPEVIEVSNIKHTLFEQYILSVDDLSSTINYDKNLILIQSRCQALHIPLVTVTATQPPWVLSKNDPSSDDSHYGINTHKEIAEFFKNRLQNI